MRVSGGARTRTLFRLHYKQLPLNASFAPGMTTVVRNSTPSVIDGIYYPATQTGYWFNETGSDASYSTFGMIAKVIEQRGMNWAAGAEEQGQIIPGIMTKQAKYNYPLTTVNETGRTPATNLTDAPTYDKMTETWDGMDVAEPLITTYNVQQNTFPRVITVTRPTAVRNADGSDAGLKIVSKQYSYNNPNQFNDGLVYQDETFIQLANGTLQTPAVSKSTVQYLPGEYDSAKLAVTEVTDEGGRTLRSEFDYSGGKFNQITHTCDYDESNSHRRIQCTRTLYENSSAYIGGYSSFGEHNGKHIFNLVTSTQIEDPNLATISRADYEYDNNFNLAQNNHNLTDAPGVIMHDEHYSPFTTQTEDCNCFCNSYDEYGYCTQYICSQCSIYNPSTSLRGNVTKTISYANAAAPDINQANVQTKAYDKTGNAVTSSSSCCEQTSYQYTIGTQYAYPESQTRGAASGTTNRMTTSATYNFETGLQLSATDANGRISSTQYNADTLRPRVTYAGTGAYTTAVYDDAAMTVTGEVREASATGSPGVLASKNIKYLNGVGRVRREDALGANNIWDIVETKYNNLGEIWKQSRPYRAGDVMQWNETVYDAQGQTIKTIAPDGSAWQAFYNETTRPDSATNLPGRTIRVADAWGRERWGRFDIQGNLAEIVEPNPTGNGSVLAAGSLVTKYTYDSLRRLTQTDQGAQLRKFQYDSLSRITRQKLAEQTATLDAAGVYVGAASSNAVWSEAFWYDNRSNLVAQTDPRGVKINYSYQTSGADDPLNRLQSITFDLSAPRDPNLPIAPAAAITYKYVSAGDLDRIEKITADNASVEEYFYDAEGRVSDYKLTNPARPAQPLLTTYLYDTLDRETEVRYPAQYGVTGNPRKIVTQTYDTASRLANLKVNGQTQVSNLIFNAANQTTSLKIGAAGVNQETESYTFDPQTGLLTNQKAQRGATTLLDLSYDYNRNNSTGTQNGKTGHLTKILNNLDHNKDREYQFDALGRLAIAKGGNVSTSKGDHWQQQYSYDRYGNRTNVAATGTAANGSSIPRDGLANVSYDLNTNRITTTGFQYDAAGNQIRALAPDGVTWLKNKYDAANRLVEVKRDDGSANGVLLQTFAYGASNARLSSTDVGINQTTYYAMAGGTTLAEYTESNGSTTPLWTKSYVYLGDSLLSTITPNGASETIEFNHPDRLGTRLITNQSAGTSYEQTTLPFGIALNAESTRTNNNKRFTSYDRSAATGLDYAVNRTYDSNQGRFTTVDPIKMSAANLSSPQTLNLYSYCGNDPVNFTDSNGLFWGSFFRVLWRVIKKAFYAAVRAAVQAVTAYILSGFNPAGFFAVFIKQFISNLGVSIAKDYLTPGFNPNLGHPLARKSGELWKYVIRNFQASGVGNLPLGVVGVIANFLAALQSAANDELIHCDKKVQDQISAMTTRAESINRVKANIEVGFIVNRVGGQLVPGPLIVGDQQGEIAYSATSDIAAFIHWHPSGNLSPSLKDTNSAQGIEANGKSGGPKHVVYMYGNNYGLRRSKLFNGNDPTDGKGNNRVIIPPDCPKKKKGK